jgi:predicted permease
MICANVAGILLVQGQKRQKEIAVRSALGAGAMRVLRQLLTESIVLSLTGGILGIAVAYALLLILLGMAPGNLPRIHESDVNYVVLGFGFAVAVGTGILFGTLPGLQLLRSNTNDQLKSSTHNASEGRNSQRIRSLLVVLQVALTIVVTSGALLMIQSLIRLYSLDPGFDSQDVLTLQVNLPERNYADPRRSIRLVEGLLENFKRLPGVLDAASTNALPLSGPALNQSPPLVGFTVEGAISERRSAQVRFVTPEYFKTLRIPILRGRDFSSLDRGNSPRVVVVNQSLARQAFHDEFPLGKRMMFGGVSHEIVGIVPDTRDEDLRRPPGPMYFMPFFQQSANVNMLTTKVRFVVRHSAGADIRTLTDLLRNAIISGDNDLAVFEVHTMSELRRLSLSRTTLTASVLGVFGLLGLFLAGLGLYGGVSNSVSQRAQEFGIRMALGAAPREVLLTLMRHVIGVCGFGVLLGIPASVALSRLMRGLVFGVSPHDPITLGSAAVLLIAVAAGASIAPARRAIRIDLIGSLRHE